MSGDGKPVSHLLLCMLFVRTSTKRQSILQCPRKSLLRRGLPGTFRPSLIRTVVYISKDSISFFVIIVFWISTNSREVWFVRASYYGNGINVLIKFILMYKILFCCCARFYKLWANHIILAASAVACAMNV